MVEQIQKMFFSKENISNLNKILLEQTNKQNISRDSKQEIINLLIKNMKIIFKQIDLSKVNNSNINTLFEQFKNHSLRNTINEIQTPSELKFNRDFNSNPTKGNKLMERPTSTKFNEPNNNNSFPGFNNNFEASLDQAFKPIVDNQNEQNQFNNYTNGRNKDDIKNLMSDIQQSRTQELNNRNQRPPTPEFLKPKKTSNKEEPPTRTNELNIQNNSNIQSNSNAKLDFKKSTSDQFNIGFQGLSNDISGDLFSLDNIDKPLIEEEIIEDNNSFEDRLKKLQSDRGTLALNNNQDKVDFTSEKFPNSDIGDNSFKKFIPVQNQHVAQREQIQRQQDKQRDQLERQEIQRQQDKQRDQLERQEIQRQQDKQRDQLERQEIQRQQDKQRDQLERKEIQRQQLDKKNIKNIEPVKQIMKKSIDKATEKNPNINNLKNKIKTMNINVKSDTIKIEELEKENNELRETIENENSKLNEIKKQIAQEFHLLEIKETEISKKINELEIKEKEIIKKNNELEILEIDIDAKNKKYDYLFKSIFLQLEVSDINNKSSYIWKINKSITNIIGIKLMSYSIPQSIYNINKYNNYLSIKVNDETININIDEGKYNIEELISILNSKLINYNIKISVNNQQKIIIESEIKFDIINTCMSEEILGFISESKDNNKYISNNVWDLRTSDKVYLYLNNILDNPFGILYFNGHSDIQIKFKDPFDTDLFDISFKDSKGREYDFNNLPHSLSFVIEQLKN